MTFLPDVNVWVALAVIEHEQHRQAAEWFESIAGHDLAFCRVTQMGFLRLLTNSHVMKGDQLTPEAAWQCLDRVYREVEPVFVAEPEHLEKAWRGITGAPKAGPNLWTDGYLAAFAQTTGYTFVTFDRGVSRYKKTPVRILDSRL
jgi:toxin-antitoxin system PIN domain toxin